MPSTPYEIQTNSAARVASLGATRQMIATDSFEALTALLVTTNAVPARIMADAFDALADKLIAKARGEMEADVMVFPSELFERANQLSRAAYLMRKGS